MYNNLSKLIWFKDLENTGRVKKNCNNNEGEIKDILFPLQYKMC